MIKRMLSHALTVCLLVLFILLFCLVARAFEIDEFIDGRDKTAILVVTCDNGSSLKITFKRKDLDKVQIEKLYDQIEELCRDAKNK